jgi:hypothetical protein
MDEEARALPCTNTEFNTLRASTSKKSCRFLMYSLVQILNNARNVSCCTIFRGAIGSDMSEALFDMSCSKLGKFPHAMEWGKKAVMTLFMVDNFSDDATGSGSGF